MTESTEKCNKKNHDDKLSQAIGDLGRWQIFECFMIALPLLMALPNVNFGITFMAPETKYRCLERANATGMFENLTCYSDCTKYEYFSELKNTIIEQWDLICDRAWLADFTQTVCMFGNLVGSIIFGSFSDRHGRRLALFIGGSMECLLCFIMPFCKYFWGFIAIRFLLGVTAGGTTITSFVLLVELIGPNKRNLFGSIYMMPCALGRVLISTIAFYFRSWKEFTVALAFPLLISFTYLISLPESPKWLISVGRVDEAVVVMTSAAKWNKLPTNGIKKIADDMSEDYASSKTNTQKANIMDLLTSPSLRTNYLYCCFIWFATGISYFGSHQYFGQTTTHIFIVFALLGIVQIPNFLIGAYMSKVIGRKKTVIMYFTISAIGNGMLTLHDEWRYTKLMAGLVGAISLACIYPIICVYTSELLPTAVRGIGMGSSATMCKVGSVLAPFIAGLHTETGTAWLPPLIFALIPTVGAFVCCLLPETKGKKLEDHSEEA